MSKSSNVEDKNLMSQENSDVTQEAILPQDTVHCFPANKKQIILRRLFMGILSIASIAGLIFFLRPETQSLIMVLLLSIILIVFLLVFIQTFLIASYRVAIDYNEKKVVLRYMFRLLKIDFENFDAKDGVPDKAEQMLRQHSVGSGRQYKMYLILDDVYADACYQTTSSDLVSLEDFLKLKEECFNIARVYKAKEKYEELKNTFNADNQTEYQSLIEEALNEPSEEDEK